MRFHVPSPSGATERKRQTRESTQDLAWTDLMVRHLAGRGKGSMAQVRYPGPVRFVTGILASDARCLEAARDMVSEAWGEPELASGVWAFSNTRYYEREMGSSILRQFLSFPDAFARETLPGRKRKANDMEDALAASLATPWRRPVNLDPGYVAPEKLVLASCKNFSHRIYIGAGVFAEPTFFFRDGGIECLPWTFPDYASGEYDAFFLEVRHRLRTAHPDT